MDLDALEQSCPKCAGLGRTENPSWSNFWTQHGNLKDWFRTLDVDEQITIIEKMLPEQPAEPMFYLCKHCHGRGRILTPEGERFMSFVRSWLNPNY